MKGLVLLVGKPFYLIFLLLLTVLNSVLNFAFSRKYNNYNRYNNYNFYIKLLLTSSTLLLFYSSTLSGLPSPKTLSTTHPPLSTKIYDRDGFLLYTIYDNENRSLVSIKDIPAHLILATLAIEDNEFYKHPGFSAKGILRALSKNISDGTMYGGSTITQQLVKNTLLSSEKSIERKIKELFLAIEIELLYPKNRILEMYLNTSPYGGPVYGIGQAARVYFDKDVEKLSLAESAFLAGIPKSPNIYSPFIGDIDRGLERQKEVLSLMLSNGFITSVQFEEAMSETLSFSGNKIKIYSPHFVMYVKDLLEKDFGKDTVSRGGLEVTTTLDINIQKAAEKVVSEEIANLKNQKVTNAAVIVLNPKNGDILAMIGSADYFNKTNNGNVNAVLSLRPPGSSIKVVNYVYALSHGYTAATVVDDSPVSYSYSGSPPYSPVNYDRKFKGKMTVRSALAQSRNVPAVKILNSYGIENMIATGKSMGISTWEESQNFGLSMTLGGANTTLYDLAGVYSVIANYGVKPNINPILSVRNYNSLLLSQKACVRSNHSAVLPTVPIQKLKTLADIPRLSLISLTSASYSADFEKNDTCKVNYVIDPRVAFIITDILKDNKARSPAFGANSQLTIKDHPEVAVKTGTSNSIRDNVAIGYSQDYLVAVWVGNNDNSPMSNIASGVTGATPIFNKIMTKLLENDESKDWEIPSGLVKLPVCTSFKVPDSEEIIVKRYEEWFLEENVPKNVCLKKTTKHLKESGLML